MLNSLKTIAKRSPWPWLFAGLLTGILMTCGLEFHAQQQRQQQQDQYYGKALATMASRQAVDATLNHDLVSLQVILRDIAQNPRVANATIHDVENHLLVQAGAALPRGSEQSTLDFTAPITFHDTIAGYVTIALTPVLPPLFSRPILGTLGALLLGLLISLLQAWRTPPPAQASAAVPAPAASAPAEQMPVTAPAGGDQPTVELRLHLLNINKLARQISTTLLRQLLQNLQQHISDANRLYGGQLIQTDAESVSLRFSAATLSSARLNAICSARLICELHNQHTGIHLQIAATLVSLHLQQPLWKQLGKVAQRSHDLMPAQLPPGVLLVTRDLVDDKNVEAQVGLSVLNDHWFIVTELQPPYCELLDKQLRHLQNRVAPMMSPQ